MQKLSVVSIVMIIVMTISLNPSMGMISVDQNQPRDMNTITHRNSPVQQITQQSYAKSLVDFLDTTPSMQTTQAAYSGPAFNKTLAEQKIAYHRLLDGGYSDSMADPSTTYTYFTYLSALGGLTTQEQNSFAKYIMERYNPDNTQPFSFYPDTTNYGISMLDSFQMAIMFSQLGYTLTTAQVNYLQNSAISYLQSTQYNNLNYPYFALTFLKEYGLLGSLDLNLVSSMLSDHQNNDTNSLYYGAISTYTYPNFGVDSWGYQLIYAFQLLSIVDTLGLTLTNYVNVTSLNLYLDILKADFTRNTGYGHNHVNYNETYDTYPGGSLSTWYLLHDYYSMENQLEAYAIRIYLGNYISTGFNITSAREIVLKHNLDRYWVDNDNNGQIDRIPEFPYFGQNLPVVAAPILDMLGLFSTSASPAGQLIDNTLARGRVKHYMHVEGGMSSEANMQGTVTALSSLYHMDRNGLSYINSIDIEASLRFLRNQNQSRVEYFSNGTAYRATYFYRNYFLWYGNNQSIFNDYYSVDAIRDTKEVINIFSKLGRLSDLAPLRSNMEKFFLDFAESGLYNSYLIRSYDAIALTEGAALLGIENKINWSRVITDISSYQTRSGGFVSSLYWTNSFSLASSLQSLPGLNFDQNNYQKLIKDNLVEQSSYNIISGYRIRSQGIPYQFNESNYNQNPDYTSTYNLVEYLKSSGLLQSWISQNIINATEIAYRLVSSAYTQFVNGKTYPGSYYNGEINGRIARALSYLGFDPMNLPIYLQDLNMTSTIQFSLDSYITPDKSTTELPVGSFTYRPGDTYSNIANTYQHLLLLNWSNSLNQIDKTATINYLQSLQITDPASPYYGLFSYRSDYNWADVSYTYYAVKGLEMLGSTPLVSVFNANLPQQMTQYSPQVGYYYYINDLVYATQLVGYGGVTTADFNLTRVNNILDYYVTSYGFPVTALANLQSTYESVESLRNIGDFSKINRETMWNFVADLQIMDSNDYRYGSFSPNPLDSWQSGFNQIYEALYILYRDFKIPLVDSGSATDYLHRRFNEIGGQSNYFPTSMRDDIYPAVRTFDTLNDYLIPKVVAPISLIQGQSLDLTITTTNIWRETVASKVEVFLNGTSYGTATVQADGSYTFQLDTTSLAAGRYLVNVTASDLSNYYRDNDAQFWVSIIRPVLDPVVDYSRNLTVGKDLSVSVNPLDNFKRLTDVTGIEIGYDTGTSTPTKNADGTYSAVLPFNSYTIGDYQFTVSINTTTTDTFTGTYNVTIVNNALTWTTSSADSSISQSEPWNATGSLKDNDGNFVSGATFTVLDYTGPGDVSGDTFSATEGGSSYKLAMVPGASPALGEYSLNLTISATGFDSIVVSFTFTRVAANELNVNLIYDAGGKSMNLGDDLNVTVQVKLGGTPVTNAVVSGTFASQSLSFTNDGSGGYFFTTSTEHGKVGFNSLKISVSSGGKSASISETISLVGGFGLSVSVSVVDDTGAAADVTDLDNTKTYYMHVTVSHGAAYFSDKGATLTASSEGHQSTDFTWKSTEKYFEGTLDLAGITGQYSVKIEAVATGDSSVTGSYNLDVHIKGKQTAGPGLLPGFEFVVTLAAVLAIPIISRRKNF